MAFITDGINELFEIRCAHVLFCDPDGSAFADDNDLDLARVLHLALNAVSDIVSQDDGLSLVDDFGLDHDADFAACLDSVGALDALVGVGDFLELLKTLDVCVEGFFTCTRTRCGNGVGCLHEYVEDAVRLDVVVVCFDRMDDFGTLSEAACKVCADDGMAALDFVVNRLA